MITYTFNRIQRVNAGEMSEEEAFQECDMYLDVLYIEKLIKIKENIIKHIKYISSN